MLNSVYYALEQAGINKAGLVVFKTNEVGNSFWQSQGWEERTDLKYYSKAINANNV